MNKGTILTRIKQIYNINHSHDAKTLQASENALEDHFRCKMRYPADAREKHISGNFVAGFAIDTNGKIVSPLSAGIISLLR